jgi:hypothetical protein
MESMFTDLLAGGAAIEIISEALEREAMERSFYERQAYNKVISDEGRNMIKTVKFDPAEHKEERCSIMHIPFEEGDEISMLPCGHYFDKEGISKWLENEKAECPVCREALPSVEKKRKEEDTESRQALLSNLERSSLGYLSRAMFPPGTFGMQHPFGPRNVPIVPPWAVNGDPPTVFLNELARLSMIDPFGVQADAQGHAEAEAHEEDQASHHDSDSA